MIIGYYQNGQVKSDGVYRNDKKNGSHKRYYENGKIRIEKIYKDDELIDSKDY